MGEDVEVLAVELHATWAKSAQPDGPSWSELDEPERGYWRSWAQHAIRMSGKQSPPPVPRVTEFLGYSGHTSGANEQPRWGHFSATFVDEVQERFEKWLRAHDAEVKARCMSDPQRRNGE